MMAALMALNALAIDIMLPGLQQIGESLGVDFKDINVLDNVSVRDGIKAYSNWPTIPQLYVKGDFIGGCDIVREMFQAGELQELLTEKGVAHNAQTLTA